MCVVAVQGWDEICSEEGKFVEIVSSEIQESATRQNSDQRRCIGNDVGEYVHFPAGLVGWY